jgi:hypothetical protein
VGSVPLSPSITQQTRLSTSAAAPLSRVAAHWAYPKSTVCKLQRAPCAWRHATGIGNGKTAAYLPGNWAFQSKARPRAACTDLCIGLSTGFVTASVDNLPRLATQPGRSLRLDHRPATRCHAQHAPPRHDCMWRCCRRAAYYLRQPPRRRHTASATRRHRVCKAFTRDTVLLKSSNTGVAVVTCHHPRSAASSPATTASPTLSAMRKTGRH